MLRLTPEEFDNLRGRIKAATQQRAPIHRPRDKRTKYGNQITWFNGLRFDSKSEAQRYVQLLELEKIGRISDLKIQVVFDLLPEQEVDGVKEKPVRYIADFTYIENGKRVIEDVKSGPTKTVEYRLKKKLMLYFHRIAIKEVMVSS